MKMCLLYEIKNFSQDIIIFSQKSILLNAINLNVKEEEKVVKIIIYWDLGYMQLSEKIVENNFEKIQI